MKLFAGVAVGCVCVAVGIVTLVKAKTTGMKDFVYETATAQEQTDWLYRQAKLYRRDIAGHLPNGWGWSSAPKLEVARVEVDRGSRVIHFRIEAREPAALVENARSIEHKWLKRVCLKFIHGTLYKTGVNIVDSFHLMDGDRVFQTIVSPERCDKLYPPVKLSGAEPQEWSSRS